LSGPNHNLIRVTCLGRNQLNLIELEEVCSLNIGELLLFVSNLVHSVRKFCLELSDLDARSFIAWQTLRLCLHFPLSQHRSQNASNQIISGASLRDIRKLNLGGAIGCYGELLLRLLTILCPVDFDEHGIVALGQVVHFNVDISLMESFCALNERHLFIVLRVEILIYFQDDYSSI